jgi:hypothetical protein
MHLLFVCLFHYFSRNVQSSKLNSPKVAEPYNQAGNKEKKTLELNLYSPPKKNQMKRKVQTVIETPAKKKNLSISRNDHSHKKKISKTFNSQLHESLSMPDLKEPFPSDIAFFGESLQNPKKWLSEMPVPLYLQQAIQQTQKDILFLNEKGPVNKEILKSHELGFVRRLYRQFYQSLIHQMNQAHLRNQLQFIFQSSTQVILNITYNIDGNAIRTKLVKRSLNPYTQDFFIEALENMKIIPNIPPIFFGDGKEVTIQYFLEIY